MFVLTLTMTFWTKIAYFWTKAAESDVDDEEEYEIPEEHIPLPLEMLRQIYGQEED